MSIVRAEKPVDMAPIFRAAWRHVGAEVLKHQRCVGQYEALSPNHRWYCLQTHPGHDLLSAMLLLQRDVVTFVALFERDRDGEIDIDLLFPSYVFVAVDRDREELLPRVRVSGFRALIGGGLAGMPVAPGVVEALIARTGPDGLIDDLRQPSAPSAGASIQVGATVQVKDGPFASFEGICRQSTATRVAILLSIFGRQTPVELRPAQVRVVA